MSVYNDEEYVRAAIESVLNQTFRDFEFIIIDDASTDKSKEVLTQYKSNDQVLLLTNESNLGLTASLNKGLKHASGEYIARQDADDISRTDRFETQIVHLRSNPSVGVIGTDAWMINNSGDKQRRRYVPSRVTRADLIKQNRLVHGSVMIRRELLEQLGGYNEIFQYAQDYELWLRLIERTTIENVTEPLYHFREHGDRIAETKLLESMLYKHLAIAVYRDGRADLLPLAEKNGIHTIYNELPQDTQAQIHQSAAEVYLKQYNRTAVREEARRLFKLDITRFRSYLLYLLSYTQLGTMTVVSLYHLFQQIARKYRTAKQI